MQKKENPPRRGGSNDCTIHQIVFPVNFHPAPPGRENRDRELSQGFTLGYFRILPPGGAMWNREGRCGIATIHSCDCAAVRGRLPAARNCHNSFLPSPWWARGYQLRLFRYLRLTGTCSIAAGDSSSMK